MCTSCGCGKVDNDHGNRLAQLTGVWSVAMAQLQGPITGWQTPL